MLPVQEVVGASLHMHMLILNIGKKAKTCFFYGFPKIKNEQFMGVLSAKMAIVSIVLWLSLVQVH
jgi:hypothetical protein